MSNTLTRFAERAVAFHKALTNAGAYQTPLSEREFLDRCRGAIESAAAEATDSDEPELALLALPLHLLPSLTDTVSYASWDYEEGFRSLFDGLTQMFARSPFTFQWRERNGTISCSLGASSCALEQGLLDEVAPDAYRKIERCLLDEIEPRGWVLYDFASGDQTALTILLRSEGIAHIKEFLIAGDDSRAELFYG